MPANKSNLTLSISNYTMSAANYTVQNASSNLNNYTGLGVNNYTVATAIACITSRQTVKISCRLRADFEFRDACLGDTLVFTDHSVDSSGLLISSRNWDFGDGERASGPVMKHRYKSPGVYKVRLIVNSVSGSSVCSDTLEKSISQSSAMRIVSMPSDTLICIGDSVRLSAPLLACAQGPFTFRWSPAAGLDDPGSSRPYFAPRISTLYTLWVRNAAGDSVSASFTVNVNTACCKSKARFSIQPAYACPGDTVRLINESTHDASSSFFQWTFNGAQIVSHTGLNPPPLVFSSGAWYSIQLALSDLCANDTSILMYRVRALPSADAGRDTVLCRRDTLSLGSESFGMNRYVWSPSAGLSSPVVSDPLLVSDSNGLYTVRVTDEFGCSQTDSVRITHRFLPFRVSSDTSYCAGDSVMLRIPGSGGYQWSNGLQTQTAWFSRPGLVWAQRSAECNYRDSILISEAALPDFSLGSDTGYCRGASLRLGAGIPGSYYWSDGSSGTSLSVSSPGIYWLRVSTGSCSSTDSVAVKEWALPVFSLGPDRKICRDPLLLSPSVYYPGSLYGWNTGQTDSSIRSGLPGLYILRVSSTQGCSYTDSVQLNAGQLAQLSAIPAVYKCSGHTYRMELPVIPGQSYEWYDGSSGPVKLFTQSGTYSVKARTECGDTSIGFTVNDSSCTCGVWLPSVFTPNGDQKNDLYGPVSECSLIEYSMKIYTRWGEMVYETHDPGSAWDGTYKGKTVPVGVYMYVIEFRKDLPGFKEYNALNGTFLLME